MTNLLEELPIREHAQVMTTRVSEVQARLGKKLKKEATRMGLAPSLGKTELQDPRGDCRPSIADQNSEIINYLLKTSTPATWSPNRSSIGPQSHLAEIPSIFNGESSSIE